jgi:hypothetical protein
MKEVSPWSRGERLPWNTKPNSHDGLLHGLLII